MEVANANITSNLSNEIHLRSWTALISYRTHRSFLLDFCILPLNMLPILDTILISANNKMCEFKNCCNKCVTVYVIVCTSNQSGIPRVAT